MLAHECRERARSDAYTHTHTHTHTHTYTHTHRAILLLCVIVYAIVGQVTDHTTVVRRLHDSYSGFIRRLHGGDTAVTRRLHGAYVTLFVSRAGVRDSSRRLGRGPCGRLAVRRSSGPAAGALCVRAVGGRREGHRHCADTPRERLEVGGVLFWALDRSARAPARCGGPGPPQLRMRAGSESGLRWAGRGLGSSSL